MYTLEAESIWLLNLPNGERFDASGLLRIGTNQLLTINDRGPSLYEVILHAGGGEADLQRLPGVFEPVQLEAWAAEKTGRYDSEGIARDDSGRLYICEEADRWILRCDPKRGRVERLGIDWSPVRRYFSSDRNASFEGIAIGGKRMYVANERQTGRIIEVDLATLKVTGSFSVGASGRQARDVHYSDLSWHGGRLFALLRESHCVLEIDPETHRVEAEYSFAGMELERHAMYRTFLPVGLMEGLAVDDDWIWLVTDNNGLPRAANFRDIRPTLFRCRRPESGETSP